MPVETSVLSFTVSHKAGARPHSERRSLLRARSLQLFGPDASPGRCSRHAAPQCQIAAIADTILFTEALKVAVRNVSNVRGLFASSTIKPGEVLLSVPGSFALTHTQVSCPCYLSSPADLLLPHSCSQRCVQPREVEEDDPLAPWSIQLAVQILGHCLPQYVLL